jgi:hypothetical protein
MSVNERKLWTEESNILITRSKARICKQEFKLMEDKELWRCEEEAIKCTIIEAKSNYLLNIFPRYCGHGTK